MQVSIGKHVINTLGPEQNGGHLADNIFKCIFLEEILNTLLQTVYGCNSGN